MRYAWHALGRQAEDLTPSPLVVMGSNKAVTPHRPLKIVWIQKTEEDDASSNSDRHRPGAGPRSGARARRLPSRRHARAHLTPTLSGLVDPDRLVLDSGVRFPATPSLEPGLGSAGRRREAAGGTATALGCSRRTAGPARAGGGDSRLGVVDQPVHPGG